MYLDRPVASWYWKSMKRYEKQARKVLPFLQAGVVEYGQPIDLDADIKASCAFELAIFLV
jgi:ribosome biogenesis protein Tsr3